MERNIVQGFNSWLDGFWKVIAGFFKRRDHIKIEEHTFTELGCNCITPPVECCVQKTWFTIEQPCNPMKRNSANVSWMDGNLIIHAYVEEVPCKIKWFNIF